MNIHIKKIVLVCYNMDDVRLAVALVNSQGFKFRKICNETEVLKCIERTIEEDGYCYITAESIIEDRKPSKVVYWENKAEYENE